MDARFTLSKGSAFDLLPEGEMKDAAVKILLLETMRIHSKEGYDGFMSTRREAAIHEAGHVVMNTVEATPTRRAVIWEVKLDGRSGWGGRTFVRNPNRHAYVITPTSDPHADLAVARLIIAGLVAENLVGFNREASSLDEIIVGQLVVKGAAEKLKVDEIELWNKTYGYAGSILHDNGSVLMEIATVIDTHSSIAGKRLRKLTDQIRKLHS